MQSRSSKLTNRASPWPRRTANQLSVAARRRRQEELFLGLCWAAIGSCWRINRTAIRVAAVRQVRARRRLIVVHGRRSVFWVCMVARSRRIRVVPPSVCCYGRESHTLYIRADKLWHRRCAAERSTGTSDCCKTSRYEILTLYTASRKSRLYTVTTQPPTLIFDSSVRFQ